LPSLANLMQATLNIGEDDSTDNQTNGSSNKPASAGLSSGGRLIEWFDGKPIQNLQFSSQLPRDSPTQILQPKVLPPPSASTENSLSPNRSHTILHSIPQKLVRNLGSRAGPLATTLVERARTMRRIGACWQCRFVKVKVS